VPIGDRAQRFGQGQVGRQAGPVEVGVAGPFQVGECVRDLGEREDTVHGNAEHP
jgi:hypothetical protein